MEKTCCIVLRSINLPIDLPGIQPKIVETTTRVIESSRTPSVANIIVKQESEYTEAQFNADLRKASKRLDSMVSKGLKEHSRGKTRKFPA